MWLAGSEPFSSVDVLPDPPGMQSPGLAGLPQWLAVASFGRRRARPDRGPRLPGRHGTHPPGHRGAARAAVRPADPAPVAGHRRPRHAAGERYPSGAARLLTEAPRSGSAGSRNRAHRASSKHPRELRVPWLSTYRREHRWLDSQSRCVACRCRRLAGVPVSVTTFGPVRGPTTR
jgi:hypothetical protein